MHYPVLTGAVLVLFGSTLATPAAAPVVPPHRPAAHPAPSFAPRGRDRVLYSPRARRLVQGYLRLRLLEAREAELVRVRAVIERKLAVDALFSETPGPTHR